MYKTYISVTREIFTNGIVLLLVGSLALIYMSFIPLFVFGETNITLILPTIASLVFLFVCYKLRYTNYV